MLDGATPLVWLHAEIKTPPFLLAARLEAGMALRRLQRGEALSLPLSRPMPSIGPRCHELRIRDANANWRIVYRTDADAIVIAAVFAKSTPQTPMPMIRLARDRLARYDAAADPK